MLGSCAPLVRSFSGGAASKGGLCTDFTGGLRTGPFVPPGERKAHGGTFAPMTGTARETGTRESSRVERRLGRKRLFAVLG